MPKDTSTTAESGNIGNNPDESTGRGRGRGRGRGQSRGRGQGRGRGSGVNGRGSTQRGRVHVRGGKSARAVIETGCEDEDFGVEDEISRNGGDGAAEEVIDTPCSPLAAITMPIINASGMDEQVEEHANPTLEVRLEEQIVELRRALFYITNISLRCVSYDV